MLLPPLDKPFFEYRYLATLRALKMAASIMAAVQVAAFCAGFLILAALNVSFQIAITL